MKYTATLSAVQVGQAVKSLLLLGEHKITIEETEKDRFVVTTTTETVLSKKSTNSISRKGVKNNSLPVQDIAKDDCLLFLWATFPNLDVALETIRRWGFQYKTAAFVWVKRNRKSPSWFWGLGNWTRANAEICLLATKGKPKRASASVHSIIDAPIGRHSEKPAETRDRIVQLAGGGSMIELFARKTAPGWDSWGDEVEGGETE